MSDQWTLGYRAALDLAHDEPARDLVLRSQAWSWSRERLAGYLLGHEQFLRNVRCTCHECPIHDGAPATAGSN